MIILLIIVLANIMLIENETHALTLATDSNVKFYFYTRKNPNDPTIFTAAQFNLTNLTNFNKNLRSLFIVHGWIDGPTSPINTLIKSAALNKKDLNIFVVDWSTTSQTPDYIAAKKNALVVGGIVGDRINQMRNDFGYSSSNIYMVGHSLGAHACGRAGAKTGGLVDVIIGLDAALPFFSVANIAERLDPSDAEFVQVIHTNGNWFGFYDPIGDVDFYPNGGKTQPGCPVLNITGCSHRRAYEYYAESINSNNFIATACQDYSAYKNGACSSNDKAILGTLDVDKNARGNYYLETRPISPFALG